ncbi:hypothetical protein [Methylobacterium sp. 17Sr1-1]|uniref:hypothetical protein n=1 Tax=Methylobacterium sp. 17Sr1-1 TaxID=2202826 RepID=UPI000D6F27F1|nr:hypothetical protein [Methylobacterium sp. 17Sr1-1]AWN52304.1 hypothetical protein DK412_12105 [Methylobacterium sp. 17Sr1-1]
MDEAARTKARKLAAKRINERLKLLASFFNALALGVIGAGVIIPTVADMTRAWPKSLVWLVTGLVLHCAAQSAFTFLRSED